MDSNKPIIINLLNYNSPALAGTGYFMKRVFIALSDINFNSKLIIYYPKSINVKKVFEIRENLNCEFHPVNYINNFFSRILYEQFIWPFKICTFNSIIYSPTPSVPFLAKVFNSRIELIPTIHDLISLYFKKKYTFGRRLYINLLNNWSLKFADRVITVSKNSKEDLIKKLKGNESKIHVVYNFLPEYTPENESTCEKLFVTISTIEPGKNLNNVIRGFNNFIRIPKYKDYKLIIIGSMGWNYREVVDLPNKLSIESNVTFTGYLSDIEKNSYIKKSMGLIYLSAYEGFGIPPLEAMYFGKPSLVSNTSSLPEVVGEAGITCNPFSITEIEESMIELVERRDELIEKINQQITKFDPLLLIEKFVSVLKQLSN